MLADTEIKLQFTVSTKMIVLNSSAVSIATGYGLDDRGVGVTRRPT
jgi:hypothetical protein